jgi:sugar lactone lactonase YvrE
MAIDTEGKLWVASFGGSQVTFITSNSKVLFMFSTSDSHFSTMSSGKVHDKTE